VVRVVHKLAGQGQSIHDLWMPLRCQVPSALACFGALSPTVDIKQCQLWCDGLFLFFSLFFHTCRLLILNWIRSRSSALRPDRVRPISRSTIFNSGTLSTSNLDSHDVPDVAKCFRFIFTHKRVYVRAAGRWRVSGWSSGQTNMSVFVAILLVGTNSEKIESLSFQAPFYLFQDNWALSGLHFFQLTRSDFFYIRECQSW
jgi:hypothetical protein